MPDYSKSAVSPRSIGSVEQEERRIIQINIGVHDVTSDENAEYVLVVNGRTVKRMNRSAAQRMGFFYEI